MEQKEEDTVEWQEIKLPNTVVTMGGETGTLHYLELEKRWTVFVHEPRMYEAPPMHDDGYADGYPPGGAMVGCYQPVVRWSVAFEDNEVAGGAVGTVETAKRIALTILEALEQGPPPEIPQTGGYRIIRGQRGGGH